MFRNPLGFMRKLNGVKIFLGTKLALYNSLNYSSKNYPIICEPTSLSFELNVSDLQNWLWRLMEAYQKKEELDVFESN
jgi:hypothetical protein